MMCAILMQVLAKPSPCNSTEEQSETNPPPTIRCKRLTQNETLQEKMNLQSDMHVHWSFWMVPPLKDAFTTDTPEFNKKFVTAHFTYIYGKESKRCPPPKNIVGYDDDDSECPVHYVIQQDPNRIPESIVHVRCSCKKCRYMNGTSTRSTGCEQIFVHTKVRRRISNCSYVTVFEEVPISCRCASQAKYKRALDYKK